ncbi:MAG: serine hydrolase domain-containing protein [Gemmataceae bacterium]
MLPLLLLAVAVEAPASEIQSALQPFVDRGSLAGAVVLVSDKERTLAVEAVGFADVGGKRPMKPDALFWIASQSKPITAAALMILVDEGKVKLDDPVTKYLPEFKQQKIAVKTATGTKLEQPKQVMTVRHLLSHTSGMPFASAKEKPTLDGLTLKDAVQSYADTPLVTEPGTKFQYANTGINTAGRIIEVVSGMPYEEFLTKHLFEPLGMKDTTFWPNKEQLARLAKVYRPAKGSGDLEETKIAQLRYPLDDRTRQPMPGGGLFSTADDVAAFCRMVLNGGKVGEKRILSEAAVKEMTTKQTGKLPENYGLGWSAGPAFGHGGALATNMTIDPKSGLITIFLVQHAGFPRDGGKAQGAFVNAARKKYAR